MIIDYIELVSGLVGPMLCKFVYQKQRLLPPTLLHGYIVYNTDNPVWFERDRSLDMITTIRGLAGHHRNIILKKFESYLDDNKITRLAYKRDNIAYCEAKINDHLTNKASTRDFNLAWRHSKRDLQILVRRNLPILLTDYNDLDVF